MQLIINPEKTIWPALTKRPVKSYEQLENLVKDIFKDVKDNGDEALKKYTLQFDTIALETFQVDKTVLASSIKNVPIPLQKAIKLAKKNIENFHTAQKQKIRIIKTSKGVRCWSESRAIEKVGLYIPGGSAPLFSTVLMLGIPAVMAGCKEIILCTPPGKNGEINPVILYTAHLIGIKTIFTIGGIQSIAALTLGTQSIPRVDKLFGPGNQFVTAAKQEAQKYVAIDMPAGPSEVLIIADKNAVPSFVASDLLAQAEHGTDSQVIVLGTDKIMLEKIVQEVNFQLQKLPRKEIVLKTLENSKAILLQNLNDCIEFSNLYAPEHLILAVKKPEQLIKKISSAGSVFLGNYSCESAGDYASGTNHTLPTNGFARSYSGVSLNSFLKTISFQEINKKGIKNIGPAIEIMAEAEGLTAHKNSVSVRLKSIQ